MKNKKNTAVTATSFKDGAISRLKELVDAGELSMPKNFPYGNIIQSAWLKIQDTKDASGAPVLQSCTKASISSSMLATLVLGLDPAKKQVDYIAYGNILTAQRSMHGTKATVLRMRNDIKDIIGEVVYEGEEKTFKFKLERGKVIVVNHERSLSTIGGNAGIVGAYCQVYGENGEVVDGKYLTFEQIKERWKNSKAKPFDSNGGLKPNSAHARFSEMMCKRTVINHTCVPIINATTDSKVYKQYIDESNDTLTDYEIEDEIEESANKGDIIDAELDDGNHEDLTQEAPTGGEDGPDDNNGNGGETDESLPGGELPFPEDEDTSDTVSAPSNITFDTLVEKGIEVWKVDKNIAGKKIGKHVRVNYSVEKITDITDEMYKNMWDKLVGEAGGGDKF